MRKLGWLFVSTALAASAHAGEPQRPDEVSALSARIYDAMQSLDAAHSKGDAISEKASRTDADEVRRALDASIRRARGDSTGANRLGKLESLSRVLANIERTQPGDGGILTPAHRAASERTQAAPARIESAATCTNALGLAAGGELNGFLASGAQMWVHVAAHDTSLRVSTSASPLDTEIAVFERCEDAALTPKKIIDDSFGVAATVGLPASKHPWLLRVRNLGSRGSISVVADDGATITGHVTAASDSHALQGSVSVFDAYGIYAGQGYVSNGDFLLTLNPGRYYVAASSTGFLNQAWQGINCDGAGQPPACSFERASAIDLETGGVRNGIDFALVNGGQIDGHVRDAETGVLLGNSTVSLFDFNGTYVVGLPSDTGGRYAFRGLGAGTYYLQAGSSMYRTGLFNNIDCAATPMPCDPLTGTPIVLGHQQRFVADVSLHSGLYVNVHVDLDTTQPVAVDIGAFNMAGEFIASSFVYSDHPSTPFGPFTPGQYRFVALATNYIPQLYANVDCTTDCSDQLASATPVALADGQPAPEITLTPHARAALSGRITDSASGAPVTDAMVQLLSTGNSPSAQSAQVGSDGRYSVVGVVPGRYWVVVNSPSHHDTAYVNAPCVDGYYSTTCQFNSAVQVTVAASDVSGIDISMPLNASITGSVRYRSPADVSFTLSYAQIELFASTGGNPIQTGYASTDGNYRIDDVAPGSYFLEAVSPTAFPQLYSGVDCPSATLPCDPASGTPVVVTGAAVRANIDFDVVGVRRLFGRVTDAATHAGVPGVAIDAWDGTADTHCTDATTDERGYYAIDDQFQCSSSSLRLSTDARPGHIDQVYQGIVCPEGPAYLGLCALDDGSQVTFPSSPQLVRVDFSLAPNDIIFVAGFDESGGGL